MHYLLKASTFADQMSTCTTAGACFVTNDSPFAFEGGSVTVTLLNVLSGRTAVLKTMVLSLAPGAGTTEWFCASDNRVRSDAVHSEVEAINRPSQLGGAATPQTYSKHAEQIPSDRGSFVKHVVGNEKACEAACNLDSACVGFTLVGSGGQCWMYEAVPMLQASPDADFYQKPGTPAIDYVLYRDQGPAGGNAAANSSTIHHGLNSTACEAACTNDPECVGFTQPNAAGYKCWFYNGIPTRLVASGANWLQKSGTKLPPVGPPAPSPAPAPPVGPPDRPPPAELSCTQWNHTAAWRQLGCDTNGTNCVLSIEVANSSGVRASLNILPFLPPKAMRLAPTTVTATVVRKPGIDFICPRLVCSKRSFAKTGSGQI